MSLFYALLVGVAMGVLLQRAGASSPASIARNLRLEHLGIIKFMATAIGVGAAGVALLVALGVPMHVDIKPTYVVGVVLGGLIFGVGFAVGGYCPGTCVVGAGEGREDALWAILGGLSGALVFTLSYGALESLFGAPLNYGKITLASALGVPPLIVAIALSAGILITLRLVPTEPRSREASERRTWRRPNGN